MKKFLIGMLAGAATVVGIISILVADEKSKKVEDMTAEELQQQLALCVQQEDYLLAARIRDLIKEKKTEEL